MKNVRLLLTRNEEKDAAISSNNARESLSLYVSTASINNLSGRK